MDEAQLIRQLQDGDEAAFRQLVELHQTRVYNTCLGFLRVPADAEDTAQEVFIEVYNKIGRFKGESALSTWLYRIAVNKSLMLIRHRKRKRRYAPLVSIDDLQELSSRDPTDFVHPGVRLEQKENAKMLQNAIEALPENQRTAFVLHKIEGLPHAQIAEVMQKKVPAIEALIHRAKENLRKILEKNMH